jgi:tRNA-dihydrouridine synthase B
MLADPARAVEVARAAVEGGGGLPVTVKLRSGLRTGDTTSGFELAHRLVAEAGVAAIGFHPRSAAVHHKGSPDYELAERLAASLPVPLILTGGMNEEEGILRAFESTGATAVMLARGALGNPWLFSRLLGPSDAAPSPRQVLAELRWTIERAVEHLGEPRATRYLRKFYPWYVTRLGLETDTVKRLQASLQAAETLQSVDTLLELSIEPAKAAA